MGAFIRVLSAVAIIMGAALSAAWTWTVSTFAPLAAVTALMMGGTGHPLMSPDSDEYINGYLAQMGDHYVQPALNRWSSAGDPLTLGNRVAVYTPEQFWPAAGDMTFDDSVALGVANLAGCVSGGRCVHNPTLGDAPAAGGPYVVFGYSQSGRVATLVKRSLIDYYQQADVDWADAPDVSFVLIGNPGRPNGGILQRLSGLSIPFFGISFDGATPTDSTGSDGVQHLRTVDISKQYDAISDFPLYPLNLLATANAAVGYFTEHGFYLESLDDPATVDQGEYGDTHYYLTPAKQLPILKLVSGILPASVLAGLDAPLRTIIELGYDRGISPGSPQSARLLRFTPIRDALTVALGVATGIDDGLAHAKGDPSFRPLGTKPVQGPFGVNLKDYAQQSAVAPEPVAEGAKQSAIADDSAPRPVVTTRQSRLAPTAPSSGTQRRAPLLKRLRDNIASVAGLPSTPKPSRSPKAPGGTGPSGGKSEDGPAEKPTHDVAAEPDTQPDTATHRTGTPRQAADAA